MMIRESLAHNLPEPDFAQRGGEFTVALWRDWLTTEVIELLGVNDRQIACLNALKTQQQIMTMEYQHLVGCSRRTAARDLDELLDKGVIQRQGAGRSAHYVLVRNRAINLPNVPLTMGTASPFPGTSNRAVNVPTVPSQEADGSKSTTRKLKKGKKGT
jgi:CTP-dependent riboflavin kinase